jgi:MATE family multidrug resistance protein
MHHLSFYPTIPGEKAEKRMNYFRKRWTGEGGYRQFLVIALPLILSTGAWSVQQFVDRMFLTWYSPDTIAAAMPAGILNFTVLSVFIGIAIYAGTFVAQYYGAGRYDRIGPAIWQGVYVAFIAGAVLLCLIPLALPIFTLVGHGPSIIGHEVAYFQILCLGGVPAVASASFSSFFSGRGKPWPVMWVNTASTAFNLILDYAFIFGKWGFPEMGIRGAALATVLATLINLFLFLLLISQKAYRSKYGTLKGWRLEKPLFMRILRFGLPSGIQFFLDIAGFTAFILILGRFGTTTLAATTIAFNINTLAFMPMLGAGMAVSIMVGQFLGKDMPDLAQQSVFSGFHLTLVYMTSIALAYVIVPDVFIAPFAAQADKKSFQDIYPMAVYILRFVAVYSVFDTLNIIFSSAIKGAGDTRFVMIVIFILSVFLLVIPTYLSVVVMGWGITVPWILATLYLTLLGFAFLFRFLGGKWKDMRVIERDHRPPILS